MFTMDRVNIRKAGHVSRCLVSTKNERGITNSIIQEPIKSLEPQCSCTRVERYMLNKVLYEVRGAMGVMNAITGSVTAKEVRREDECISCWNYVC